MSTKGVRGPRKCPNCGQESVVPAFIDYTFKQNMGGDKLYDIEVQDIPCTKCSNCGEAYFSITSDFVINNAVRKKLKLLFPADIIELMIEGGIGPDFLGSILEKDDKEIASLLSGSRHPSLVDNQIMKVLQRIPLKEILDGKSPSRQEILATLAKEWDAVEQAVPVFEGPDSGEKKGDCLHRLSYVLWIFASL